MVFIFGGMIKATVPCGFGCSPNTGGISGFFLYKNGFGIHSGASRSEIQALRKPFTEFVTSCNTFQSFGEEGICHTVSPLNELSLFCCIFQKDIMCSAFHNGDRGYQGQFGLFTQFGKGECAAVAHGGADF